MDVFVKTPEPRMKRLLIVFLVVAMLVLGGLIAVKELQPTTFQSLLLTFNIAPNAKEEKARLDRIALLAISEEKKNILRNKTIFLGASTIMVELALGNPINRLAYEQVSPRVDRWIYHFADDSRPTVLEFHDNKLASAFKVSAHKLQATHSSTTTNTPPATTPVTTPAAPTSSAITATQP